MTISLPPPLLRKAEQLAREENRTKSELLREALRFYVESRDFRKAASRERLFALIEQVQERTKMVPPRQVRKAVREALAAVRRKSRA